MAANEGGRSMRCCLSGYMQVTMDDDVMSTIDSIIFLPSVKNLPLYTLAVCGPVLQGLLGSAVCDECGDTDASVGLS